MKSYVFKVSTSFVFSCKKRNHIYQISWFQPNSSRSQLTFISIGDILFPEYASIGRFNLLSSASNSRLVISNVLTEDQGIYTCKSSSSGQHSIKLLVNCNSLLKLVNFEFICFSCLSSSSTYITTVTFTSLSG